MKMLIRGGGSANPCLVPVLKGICLIFSIRVGFGESLYKHKKIVSASSFFYVLILVIFLRLAKNVGCGYLQKLLLFPKHKHEKNFLKNHFHSVQNFIHCVFIKF